MDAQPGAEFACCASGSKPRAPSNQSDFGIIWLRRSRLFRFPARSKLVRLISSAPILALFDLAINQRSNQFTTHPPTHPFIQPKIQQNLDQRPSRRSTSRQGRAPPAVHSPSHAQQVSWHDFYVRSTPEYFIFAYVIYSWGCKSLPIHPVNRFRFQSKSWSENQNDIFRYF